MHKISLIILLQIFVYSGTIYSQESLFFAVIGDYGYSGPAESAVANLIDSRNPDFIITLGDNNYTLGQQETIDMNIGQYYSDYIFPYYGNFGTGDTVNRFFPSLGNHDWYTDNANPYLSYFTLPGNERYYDFIKGNVHFFSIDSDHNEPDGRDSSSAQALWLKNALYNSKHDFKIVYFHHPPYSSGNHGSDPEMQWPFRHWGASIVMSGHDHTYERIFFDSLTYIVNGLGGRSIYSFYTPVTGSIVRYNNNYGAMFVNSYSDSLVSEFYSISGNLKDHFVILRNSSKLNLRLAVEGMYDELTGILTEDSVKVFIRNSVSPYAISDSSICNYDSDGNAELIFKNTRNATSYFLEVKHRNSISVWSSTSKMFYIDRLIFDISSDADSVYGNNLVLKGNKYCIYSGDINNDGVIDAEDFSIADNSSMQFETGYVQSDLNGDLFVDADDLIIAEKNAALYVVTVHP